MIGELSQLIVYLLGGEWVFKSLTNRVNNLLLKKIMVLCFHICMRSQGGYIGITANISKPYPFMPHGFKGVFISGGAMIGANCTIFQNVTIGSNKIAFSKTCGSPRIGNNCYIGAGASLIGNIVIGENCRIGANATVVEDIPANSTVVTQKQNVIQREKLDNKYYKWSPRGPIYYDNGKWILEEDKAITDFFRGKL